MKIVIREKTKAEKEMEKYLDELEIPYYFVYETKNQ